MVQDLYSVISSDGSNGTRDNVITYTVISDRYLLYVDDSNMLYFSNISVDCNGCVSTSLIKQVSLASHNSNQITKLKQITYKNDENAVYLFWTDGTTVEWNKLDALLLPDTSFEVAKTKKRFHNEVSTKSVFKWRLPDIYSKVMDFSVVEVDDMLVVVVVTNMGSILNFQFYKQCVTKMNNITNDDNEDNDFSGSQRSYKKSNSFQHKKYIYVQDNTVTNLNHFANDSFSHLKIISKKDIIVTCYDNNIHHFQLQDKTHQIKFVAKNTKVFDLLKNKSESTNQVTTTLDFSHAIGERGVLIVNVNNYGCVLFKIDTFSSDFPNVGIYKAYKLKSSNMNEKLSGIGIAIIKESESQYSVLRGSEIGEMYKWNIQTHSGERIYANKNDPHSLLHSFVKSKRLNALYWLRDTTTIQTL